MCRLLTATQIITWNDYGESHYVGPLYEAGIPQGASWYVSNNPHDAWRTLLPYYIDAYKSGNSSTTNTTINADKITYWYRPNPSNSGSSGGTTGNAVSQGQQPLDPSLVSQDKIFVTVLVRLPSVVTVQVGDGSTATLRATHAGINHFSVPFDGQTGKVNFAIRRQGRTVASASGPAITNTCDNGMVNWNAVVGSSDTS